MTRTIAILMVSACAAGLLAQSKDQPNRHRRGSKDPQPATLTVDAGAFDRHNTIVSVAVPGLKESMRMFLNDGKGPTI